MKKAGLTLITLLLTLTAPSNSQGLSSIMDAIDKLDAKLTKMVQQESAERKIADAKLKKQAGGTTPSHAAAPDTALKADVERLVKAVEALAESKKQLAERVNALEEKLTAAAAGSDDERIKALALELKDLIAKLKTAVEEKQASEEPEESPQAMDVGGLVTLDYGGAFDGLDNPDYGLGEVDLAANVYLTEHLTASVVLLAVGDMSAISIDQAMAVYKNPENPVSFVFGGQTFNHGLLSTHLISDPSLIDHVELAGPGITTAYSIDNLSLGAGFTIFQNADDSTGEIVGSNYSGLLNADYIFLEESPIRISSLLSQDIIDFDLALTLAVKGLSLDLEGYSRIGAPSGDGNSSGYFVGAAYALNDMFELAVRHDGVSDDSFKDMTLRIGGGFTISLPHDLFAALEVSNEMPAEGDNVARIDVQLGLESTVKLPGFQRRTLTRN